MKHRFWVLTEAVALTASAAQEAVDRVGRAAEVMNKIMATPEQAIPCVCRSLPGGGYSPA